MKTTLLLSFLLLLTACSDNSSTKHTTEAAVPMKESPSPEAQPLKETAESTPKTVEEKPVVKEAAAPNGHALFAQKCASCHGQNGEKAALNKSQIIAGWDTKKSMDALHGYQAGTYGSSLKGIMKGQVSTLNEQQLQAIADYIATL